MAEDEESPARRFCAENGTPMETDQPPAEPAPDPVALAAEAKEEGNQRFKVGELRAAVAAYGRACKLDPQSIYFSNRAAALMRLQSFQEAMDDMQFALRLDPDNVKFLLRAARCAVSLGNRTEGERYYARVQEMDPSNATAIEELGMLNNIRKLVQNAQEALDAGHFNNALSLLNRALQLAPSDNSIKLQMAEVYVRQKNYGEADRTVAAMLRDNSTNSNALCIRGRLMYLQGELERAVDHFQRALRCDPDHKASRTELKKTKQLLRSKEGGNEAFKAGRLEEALALYAEALQVDPDNAPTQAKLYYNRALVLAKLERFDAAMVDCTTAMELDETYIKPLLKRARLKLQTEQYEEAVQDFELAAEREAGNRDIQRELQKAKLELKKSKRKNYYKILEIPKDANDHDIKKAYKKLALKHHPDRCQGDDTAKAAAEAQFKEIGEAYAVLSDSQKRERYDSGQDIEELNGPGGTGVNVNDLFTSFFAGGGGGGGFHGGFSGFG